MKNLKRALSLVLSTAMLVGMMVVGTGAAELKDIKGHDHQQAAELMAMIGVMEGDGENFNPDKAVTRNEMAVVICNLMDLKLNGYHPFTDVPEWADKYVGALYINELTSGTSATTYGGAAEVTTTEAALMIMKTLGYFEYQGEFEEDWALATVKRATLLNLFEGIEAGVKETLTRGEVAQMVMNALDENIVVAKEVGGMNVTGDGFTVSEKASYSYPGVVVGYTNQSAPIYETLMSKLFDNTLTGPVNGVANDTDAFGRPAFKWTYTGEGKNESVTVTKKPAVVFTAKTSEDDVNKALKEYTLANVTMCTNGKAQNAQTTVANKGELGNNSAVQNDTCYTANGKTVEIYADKNLNVDHIVAVDEYVGKVALVTKADEAKGTKRNVTVAGLTFETEDFAKKDMVIYTLADGVIKSMNLAEKVSGTVTAIATDDSTIAIDGVTYKANHNQAGIIPALALNDKVEMLVDNNGYLIKTESKNAAAAEVNEYVVVFAGSVDTWGTKNVKILKADGTTEIVKWNSDDNQALIAADQNGDLVFNTTKIGLYTFETTSDGYKFTPAKTNVENGKVAGFDFYATSAQYDADKGTLGGMAIADDGVFFVQKPKYAADGQTVLSYSYTIASGAELKKANTVAGTTVNGALYGNKETTGFTTIEFGFVQTTLSGTSDALFGYVTAGLNEVKNADKVTVQQVTFWNGEETVSLMASTSASTGLVKGDFFTYELTEKGELDSSSIRKVNTNGAITAFDGETIEITTQAAGVDGQGNPTINYTSTQYNVTDDTIIVFVDAKNVKGADGDVEKAEEIFDNTGAKIGNVYNARVELSQNRASNGKYDVVGLFVEVTGTAI